MTALRFDGAVIGGPRSEPARARILAAARDKFARDGYNGATIRAIAEQARIDPSLVMRYFGSKEGLFAAAAAIDLELPALRAIPRAKWGETLVRQFLDRWEGPAQDGSLRMLFRVAPTNATAATRLGNAVSTQVAAMLTAAGLDNAQQRADLMASQMLGLAYTRYVLQLPTIAHAPRDELIRDLAPTMQRYLTRTTTTWHGRTGPAGSLASETQPSERPGSPRAAHPSDARAPQSARTLEGGQGAPAAADFRGEFVAADGALRSVVRGRDVEPGGE